MVRMRVSVDIARPLQLGDDGTPNLHRAFHAGDYDVFLRAETQREPDSNVGTVTDVYTLTCPGCGQVAELDDARAEAWNDDGNLTDRYGY